MTIADDRAAPGGQHPRAAVGQLARIEARRMLRHPAPWLGTGLQRVVAQGVFDQTWASAHYEGLLTCSRRSSSASRWRRVSAFARERVPISDDAPMEPYRRSLARLLGGLRWSALVALVVGAASVWLRLRGGMGLGDEPGHTAHAYYSLPELLQPVLLACFAVALGAAVVHLVRSRPVAWIVLPLTWFLFGRRTGCSRAPVARSLTPLQVQPSLFEAGPCDADPTALPRDLAALGAGRVPGLLGAGRRLAGPRRLARPLPGRTDAAAGRGRRARSLAATAAPGGRALAVGGGAMQLVVAP